MGVAQESEVFVDVRQFLLRAVTAHDDLQRDAAHAGKGEHRIRYLTDPPPQLAYLLRALRAGYVQHQQPRQCRWLVQATAAEGGAEHQVGQPVGIVQHVARCPLLHG